MASQKAERQEKNIQSSQGKLRHQEEIKIDDTG